MISSSRLIFTKLLDSDVSAEYLDTLNDAEYMKFSRHSAYVHTHLSQSKYIKDFTLTNNMLFGIKDKENGELIGSINCYIDFARMTLDLGFLILKERASKGYASEALKCLIEYLEGQFPGMTLVIGSNRKNIAMHEVAKKLNFQINPLDSPNLGPNLRYMRKIPKIDSARYPALPDFILNAQRVGVAAHDAGGAEQISWLLRNLPRKVLAYIDGPAKRIFENSEISFDKAEQLSEIMKCDVIITGSGWMSQLELTAIEEAKLRNIPCITVLDHWVNYLERFGANEKTQPQILAVTNSVALKLAQEKFPDKLVWFLKDYQIEGYKEAIAQIRRSPTCVLILLEPTSRSDSRFAANNDVIEVLVGAAILIKRFKGLEKVVIRPHPSDHDSSTLAGKLTEFLGELEISINSSLLEDLAVSEVVLGLSSYALYISSECGIATKSYFAGQEGHWTSYFPKILPLKS